MIRQTTERLCAYDILIACIGKFNHLGCQQPTLAHLTAVADNTVYKLLCVSISVRRNKAVLFSGIDHKSLKLCEVVKKHRTEFVFNSASSEHLVVLNTVINLKRCKTHKTGYANLAILICKKVLKTVVSHFGVFYIDFADNTDFNLRHFIKLYFCK